MENSAGTHCRHCVFYNQNLPQYCKLGKLEKLVKNGGILHHMEDKGDKWVDIEGRICRFYRNQSWVDSVGDQHLDLKVQKEACVRLGVIVYIDDNTIVNPHLLQKTVNSINTSMLCPVRIIFVIHAEQLGLIQAINFINTFVETEIHYKIEVLTAPLDKGGVLNLAIPKFKDDNSQYITFIQSGYQISPHYFSNINKLINDECDRFVMVLPHNQENWDCLTLQGLSTKMYRATQEYNIMQVIQNACEEQECSHMIKKYEDIIEWSK